MVPSTPNSDQLVLVARIVAAYVSNNRCRANELSGAIEAVHTAVLQLQSSQASADALVQKPNAAQIRHSITHEGLISFEDGGRYKTLKRHLALRGLTPEEYRAKWGLPVDYPMTAQGYSEMRKALAHQLGLGSRRRKRVN